MKSTLRLLAASAGFLFATTSFAQTAATPTAVAPAVKAAPAMPAATVTAPAAPTTTAVTPPPAGAKSSAKSAPAAMPTTAAAGGGGGKVWVNTKSKTYHCEGTKFYGKTKVGEYMAEADAKAAGNHGVGGKGCAAK